jgi:hypothetical protein
MHSIRPTTTQRAVSRLAVLAASAALMAISLPGTTVAGSSGAAGVQPTDTFAWVAPTKEPPQVNRPHAGTHVGLHFSLGGDHGLDVLAPGWPRAQRVDCVTRAPIAGTLWRTHPYGSDGLEYDAATETYTYVWDVRPEWGNGALRCRQFLLKTTGGVVADLSFTFRSAPSTEPPADLACADIVDGDGSYVSKDENGDPLPEPKVVFALNVAEPSCAPNGVETRYRLYVLPAPLDSHGHPTSWQPIASQARTGDGSSAVLIFDIPITHDPAPPEVCLYAYTVRGNAIVERAPDRGCLPYTLDGPPPGFSGWN